MGDEKYAKIANRQAEKSMETHVRPNGTTYHVVNMDQKTGKPLELMTHQGKSVLPALCLVKILMSAGYSDESCWSRGQAWGIYGYAQCGEYLFPYENGC